MILLIFIFLFALIAFYFGNTVRKNSLILYILFIILGVFSFLFSEVSIFKLINQGFLGFSLIYLVMIAGAFDNKSKIRKKLIGVRKEYSILGFLAIAPHALSKLIAGLSGELPVAWFGIATFLLMIPLFITSFTFIRRKMKPKSWKQLQSLAYVIYFLLLIHLAINYTEIIGLVIYIILFAFYIIKKIIYELAKSKAKSIKKTKTTEIKYTEERRNNK